MSKSISLLLVLFSIVTCADAQNLMEKTLYHDFDKATLSDNSQHELEQLVQQLKQFDIQTISVRSHADKMGAPGYNNHLSQDRNHYILQELKAHLPADITYITGYFGEDSLLTFNGSEQEKNRRTEIIISYTRMGIEKEAFVEELVPYLEDVIEQRFAINLDDTVSITAKEGTFIKFPPGSFLNKSNKTATGHAVLLIKEYYKPGDILLSGMHSMSDNGLLQTGGMFKVLIIQNGDTIPSEALKPVQLKMPDKNSFPGQMNVFTTAPNDRTFWKDTRESFRRVESSWSWPIDEEKLRDFYVDKHLPYNRWPIGRKWSEEYRTADPLFSIGEAPILIEAPISYKRPFAKTVTYTIEKTDSVTLKVNFHEKFRRRGSRKYGTKTFDTTFLVKYSSATYESEIITTGLNYINCDRFLNAPKVTNFYVKTPGFSGAQVLVYFKNLNAFMQAGTKKGGGFEISRVPPGEEVYLIAVGKKGDEFYYGKEPFTISKKATANVSMQKVKYEEMKEMFRKLGYKG